MQTVKKGKLTGRCWQRGTRRYKVGDWVKGVGRGQVYVVYWTNTENEEHVDGYYLGSVQRSAVAIRQELKTEEVVTVSCVDCGKPFCTVRSNRDLDEDGYFKMADCCVSCRLRRDLDRHFEYPHLFKLLPYLYT